MKSEREIIDHMFNDLGPQMTYGAYGIPTMGLVLCARGHRECSSRPDNGRTGGRYLHVLPSSFCYYQE